MTETNRNRCAVCGFPIAEGCRPGDCSMRPLPTPPMELDRAVKEYGQYAPDEWFVLDQRERTYTRDELNAQMAGNRMNIEVKPNDQNE